MHSIHRRWSLNTGLSLVFSMEKDAKWLAWAEQRFAQVAGEDRLIYLDEFKKALNVKKVNYIANFMNSIVVFGFHTYYIVVIIMHISMHIGKSLVKTVFKNVPQDSSSFYCPLFIVVNATYISECTARSNPEVQTRAGHDNR